MKKGFPYHSKHQSIIRTDYSERDARAGAGDAKFLSIGRAAWAHNNSEFGKPYELFLEYTFEHVVLASMGKILSRTRTEIRY